MKELCFLFIPAFIYVFRLGFPLVSRDLIVKGEQFTCSAKRTLYNQGLQGVKLPAPRKNIMLS